MLRGTCATTMVSVYERTFKVRLLRTTSGFTVPKPVPVIVSCGGVVENVSEAEAISGSFGSAARASPGSRQANATKAVKVPRLHCTSNDNVRSPCLGFYKPRMTTGTLRQGKS
jgi:hypothetical protein